MPETNAARGSTEPAPRVEYELQLYYWMKLIRAFEERVSRLHRPNKTMGAVDGQGDGTLAREGLVPARRRFGARDFWIDLDAWLVAAGRGRRGAEIQDEEEPKRRSRVFWRRSGVARRRA